MAAFETFEKELVELKGSIVQEIVNVLNHKGYTGNMAAFGKGSDFKEYTVWCNKYGNGVIAKSENRPECHIDNFSTDEALAILAAVLRAAPKRTIDPVE